MFPALHYRLYVWTGSTWTFDIIQETILSDDWKVLCVLCDCGF